MSQNIDLNDLQDFDKNNRQSQIDALYNQIRAISAKLVFPPSIQAAVGLGAIAKHYMGGTIPMIGGAALGYMMTKDRKYTQTDKQVMVNKINYLRQQLQELQDEENFEEIAGDGIMSAQSLKSYKYRSYKFTGKWKKLIGDPAKNFHMMVYGLPKAGKSIFCTQFANYLASTFGEVLYVAAEEGFSVTIQKKIRDYIPDTANIDYANFREFEPIRETLANGTYDFCFIDSVNYIKISAEQVEQLKTENPNMAFVTIQQATKDGKHAGGQDFAHNCDIIVQVDQGIAYQRGRFQEESAMAVFPQKQKESPDDDSLDGVEDVEDENAYDDEY